MLGVLSAVNAGLRPLGAGTAGIETVFFILIFAGRVFGPGFGFSLGCTSMFASAVITGGVGPWMPYQMFGCAWVGLFAGLLPPCRGKIEVWMLATYGVVDRLLLRLHAQPSVLALLRARQFHRVPARRVGRESAAPIPAVRHHDLAGMGHRPRHHQPRLHSPDRPGRARHVPPRGSARIVSRCRSRSDQATNNQQHPRSRSDDVESGRPPRGRVILRLHVACGGSRSKPDTDPQP